MIEEFYGIDQKEVTVHFRHGTNAMVAFANGSAGFLPMHPVVRRHYGMETSGLS
jgi:hypothetical protein